MQIPFYFWIECLSLGAALVTLQKLRHSVFFWFVPFLLIIVLVEVAGLYIRQELHQRNAWLYNISLLIQLPFWMLLFKSQFRSNVLRNVTNVLVSGFLIFAIANLFFIQGFNYFNNYTFIVGAFVIIFLCCSYFLQLFREEETVLLRSAMFWVSTGAFFYFLGTFFYFALYSYLRQYQIEKKTEIFDLITLNLILVQYLCITIGLFLVKPVNK